MLCDGLWPLDGRPPEARLFSEPHACVCVLDDAQQEERERNWLRNGFHEPVYNEEDPAKIRCQSGYVGPPVVPRGEQHGGMSSQSVLMLALVTDRHSTGQLRQGCWRAGLVLVMCVSALQVRL